MGQLLRRPRRLHVKVQGRILPVSHRGVISYQGGRETCLQFAHLEGGTVLLLIQIAFAPHFVETIRCYDTLCSLRCHGQ